MIELYIENKAWWSEPQVDDTEAFADLKAFFPGRSARRMTRLGMMLSYVLKELSFETVDGLVYCTTYSETCTIEKFLDSFPYPSPQAFQTSIHPSGVEQFMIQHKQAIEEYFPLAGGDDLLLRGLSTVSLCQSQRVILCGGEERGTWLLDKAISSTRNYAWALALNRLETDRTIGRICLHGLGSDAGAGHLMADFIQSLQENRPFAYRPSSGTHLELSWRV